MAMAAMATMAMLDYKRVITMDYWGITSTVNRCL